MKQQVPVLRTMTFNQLMEELRERGMSVGQEKLKAAILSETFPFVDVFGENYFIWRGGFEKWAEEHSVMETPL